MLNLVVLFEVHLLLLSRVGWLRAHRPAAAAAPLLQVLPDGAVRRGAGEPALAAADPSLSGSRFQTRGLFDGQSNARGVSGRPWGSGSEPCVSPRTLSRGHPWGKPESPKERS